MALHGLEGWKDGRGVHPDRNFRLTGTLTLFPMSVVKLEMPAMPNHKSMGYKFICV